VTLLPLPLAGLLSPEPYESVAPKTRAIGDVLKRAGCRHEHAFVTLSFLPLVVLRELHLSDKGLVEVGRRASSSSAPSRMVCLAFVRLLDGSREKSRSRPTRPG
jgi:adenine deaminase